MDLHDLRITLVPQKHVVLMANGRIIALWRLQGRLKALRIVASRGCRRWLEAPQGLNASLDHLFDFIVGGDWTPAAAAAIGYVGLGYAVKAKDRVKVLPVKQNAGAPAVEPSEDTVRSGKYSISRPLHCYTNGKPKGDAKAFLDFCLSPAGQGIVRELGYVPLQ